MEYDNSAVIIGVILAVCMIVLIVAKAISFFMEFNTATRYLLTEMQRADEYEYRYWRRKLRCHYLCLIPFVTERNVLKVYNLLYHKSTHGRKKDDSDVLLHILAPSAIVLCICMVSLCGMSWAWFTASAGTGATSVKTSTYTLSYRIGNGEATTFSQDTSYMMGNESCAITLSAAGTEGATGYCSIQIGDSLYYTNQITADSSYTVTINASKDTSITLTPKWGSCAVRTEENTVANEGTINRTAAANNSASGNSTSDNSAAGNAASGDSTSENSTAGKSTSGNATSGNSAAGDASSGGSSLEGTAGEGAGTSTGSDNGVSAGQSGSAGDASSGQSAGGDDGTSTEGTSSGVEFSQTGTLGTTE